ncbi:MAG: bifunctional precorrin-2 dehydrogenase/sirohydrochlorin ferrochelatase [Desulforhopalus sp.]
MSLYPVTLNITDKLCLVVGGGMVALRKVRSLLAGGATVRVISPEVHQELRLLIRDSGVEWFERGFAEGDLKGAFLAFAATDDREIQKLITREAENSSVLLNCADDPRESRFHVPAHFRRGKMLITISTGGGSPALAKMIRQRFEQEIEPGYGNVVELLSMVREKVVGDEEESSSNRELFRSLLQQGIVDLVLEENWFDLQMLLLRELPVSIDTASLMKKFLEKNDQSCS